MGAMANSPVTPSNGATALPAALESIANFSPRINDTSYFHWPGLSGDKLRTPLMAALGRGICRISVCRKIPRHDIFRTARLVGEFRRHPIVEEGIWAVIPFMGEWTVESQRQLVPLAVLTRDCHIAVSAVRAAGQDKSWLWSGLFSSLLLAGGRLSRRFDSGHRQGNGQLTGFQLQGSGPAPSGRAKLRSRVMIHLSNSQPSSSRIQNVIVCSPGVSTSRKSCPGTPEWVVAVRCLLSHCHLFFSVHCIRWPRRPLVVDAHVQAVVFRTCREDPSPDVVPAGIVDVDFVVEHSLLPGFVGKTLAVDNFVFLITAGIGQPRDKRRRLRLPSGPGRRPGDGRSCPG